MFKKNFLQETKEVLERHNKTFEDVIFVANTKTKTYILPEEFARRAKKINYDNGYGLTHINTYLIVVGTDFWLERHEYDGAEWWEYKEQMYIDDFIPEDKNTGAYIYL